MNAYETTKLTDPCYREFGKYHSESKIAAFGQNTIRCACIARAHYDDVIDITPQIQRSEQTATLGPIPSKSLSTIGRCLALAHVVAESRQVRAGLHCVYPRPVDRSGHLVVYAQAKLVQGHRRHLV